MIWCACCQFWNKPNPKIGILRFFHKVFKWNWLNMGNFLHDVGNAENLDQVQIFATCALTRICVGAHILLPSFLIIVFSVVHFNFVKVWWFSLSLSFTMTGLWSEAVEGWWTTWANYCWNDDDDDDGDNGMMMMMMMMIMVRMIMTMMMMMMM